MIRAEDVSFAYDDSLVRTTLDAFSGKQTHGCYLFFALNNPISSRFWPHLGFRPLQTTYQRRRDR